METFLIRALQLIMSLSLLVIIHEEIGRASCRERV